MFREIRLVDANKLKEELENWQDFESDFEVAEILQDVIDLIDRQSVMDTIIRHSFEEYFGEDFEDSDCDEE